MLVVIFISGCSAAPFVADAGGDLEDGAGDAGPPAVRFEQDVLPVLTQHCVRCHDTPFRGDYRSAATAWPALTGVAGALPFGFGCPGGKPGGLVVPGDPARSALWQLVGVGFDAQGGCPGHSGMPKNDARGILADFDPAGAEKLRQWILQGARDD